jgi:hypothetical protein
LSATTATNPTPVLRKLYRRHRSAQAVHWLAWIATPLLGTAAVLHLLSVIWPALQTGLVPVLLASMALLAWIPVYFVNRSSLLRIAREADLALGARGAVTTTAELTMTGGPRTAWGEAAIHAGSLILRTADVRKLVPAGRFLPVFAPAVAAIAAAVIAALPVLLPAKQVIAEPEPEPAEQSVLIAIFNPADEKMLERVREDLRAKLDLIAAEGGDEKADKLRDRIDKALAKLPEDEESLRSFMDEVEGIKADMDDLIAQKQAEQEFLEELGTSMDAKLLEDLAEALEKGDAGEAAEVAEQMAEAFEKNNPKGSSMTQASEDLLEAIQNAQPLLDSMKEGKEGQEGQEGDKSQDGEEQGGDESEKGKDGEGMDPEKLASLLETLDKLAGALGIKDASSVPEGLKKLGEKLKGMDQSGEQAEKLGELVDGLENLQNLMNGAGQDGKESYKKLREDFENKAGGQKGQPGGPQGQPGGQQGQQPGGQPGQPGEGQGQGEGDQPGEGQGGQQGQGGQKGQGQGQGAGDKPGDGQGEGQPGEGQGQGAGDKPGGKTGNATESGKAGKDGQGDGQQGYGTGATDHLGDTALIGEDATYEDLHVEGEDNPGPINKDVIYGAGQGGFVDEDYKKVYDQYNSILQEIMDGEDVPSIYRFYVDKYFQLIAPRDKEPPK